MGQDLGRGCIGDRSFTAAAAHCPGPQVGNKGHKSVDAGMSRPDGIDHQQTGQRLGQTLRQCTGKRGWAGGAGLTGSADLQRHAARDGGPHDLDAFGRETQR